MKKKIICIIQARTGSKRLPKKILLPIFGKSLLEHMLLRLKGTKKINQICLATTIKKEDDIICQIAKKNKISIFRGNSNNVLKRFYDCAKKNKADTIIRVTADCPLIDTKYINELLGIYDKNNFDYMSNLNYDYLPEGFSSEVFSFASLKKSFKLAKSKFDKEHVTSFIWSNPKLFRFHHYKGKKNKKFIKNVRLTLDYLEDFVLIKKIFENLYKKNSNFSLNDIFAYLQKNKNLLKINKKYTLSHWKKYQLKRNKFNKINNDKNILKK